MTSRREIAAPCGCQLVDVEERQFCAELDRLFERYVWASRYSADCEPERQQFANHFYGAVRANRLAAA